MGVNDYFFDSYALIELIKGNPNYFRYKEQAVNITLFNLVEVAYSVFLDYGKDKAQEVYKKFREYVQDVDEETLFYALELKTMFKKCHLSYADCIGYALPGSIVCVFLLEIKSLRIWRFWNLLDK